MCEELREKKIKSDLIYKGKIFNLCKDEVLLPDGKAGVREYVRHIGAACVVPITEDGRVIVEKQFRYPFGEVLTEIPAGKLNSKNENPADAALRELKEETGFSAEKLIPLGKFYPTCAYSDEVIHMFLALKLTSGERKLDEDEFLSIRAVPIKTLIDDIIAGKIKDGKTQAALLKAYYYLKCKK